MSEFKEVMNYLGYIANIVAVFGIFYGVYQIAQARNEYKKNQEHLKKEETRKNSPISIILKEKEGNRKITLPNKIRRGELTRAEVLGRLGMIPMLPNPNDLNNKQRRFEIKKNATEEFIRDIDHLHVSSEGNKLTINCDTQEMDQFDTKEIKKLGFDVSGIS